MTGTRLTNGVLYLMSVSSGLVVANLYYNQPLLNQMAKDFRVGESAVSTVALATQLGYAAGLLVIVPLGDKISNMKILYYDFIIMIFSLLWAAVSGTLWMLVLSNLFVGAASATPQLLVPMAATLAGPKDQGRATGIVMSGLLIGIIGSRVISGFVGEQYGWRTMYYAASVMMLLLMAVLHLKLPRVVPDYAGSYRQLIVSLWSYVRKEKPLRLAAVRGALSFAALSAFWTTLVFLLEDSFGYGSGVAGMFGLIGIIGAMGATVAGRLNDRLNKDKLILYSTLLMLAAWCILWISERTITGLIAGVILVDLGQQALHVTNQNVIFTRSPEARNRVNTVYMVSFFLGGAVGTSLGAIAYENFKWAGVSGLGLALVSAIAIVHYVNRGENV